MPNRRSISELVSHDPDLSRRHKRAEALRKRAVSPVRILLMVLMLPMTTMVIAVGVYLRTSEFEREEALIHLIAMAGCDAVEKLVPGPFVAGEPGYHARNDPDGDGIACGEVALVPVQNTLPQQADTPRSRSVGTAKFVRP
ncbi:excalibur calcium-binding domain-containing protein [Ruegeria sp. SCP11]|uniref:excalibur calcium-binding domain-containing protein n=1 Tax=Ruegeria sp. SCP11 TaxID=3141378 RepID=UPI003339B4BB